VPLKAVEVKASGAARRTEARPLTEVLATLSVRSLARTVWRLGLAVTHGREVESPEVWAEPD
jgi:hypothetical protein